MNANNQDRVAIIDACRTPFIGSGTPQILKDLAKSGRKFYEE